MCSPHAIPTAAFNDPDMLCVGMPGISDLEARSHFSLWVIVAAPLFIGVDVRNLSSVSLETLSNAEAIAINQDALGVQGALINGGSPATHYAGGVMANLTDANSLPRTTAAMWTLTRDGHVVNNASGFCLATVDCGATPGTPVFLYDCVTNACGNELWSWSGNATSGQIVSLVSGGGNATCLAGADPASTPFSQLVLAPCAAGGSWSTWAQQLDSTPRSLVLLAAAPAPLRLEQFGVPPNPSIYLKPLAPANGRQDLALAVFNRAVTPLPGINISLLDLGFAPAQQVTVRDVWRGQTLGPYAVAFDTSALAPHETLLLRISLVVGNKAD